MPSFIAFLKALPELVGLARELVDGIKSLQNAITDKRFHDLNEKLEKTIKEVKNEKDRTRLLALARELNKLQ